MAGSVAPGEAQPVLGRQEGPSRWQEEPEPSAMQDGIFLGNQPDSEQQTGLNMDLRLCNLRCLTLLQSRKMLLSLGLVSGTHQL